MPIRVLLVDDHELVRQGVASMLAKAEDLTVVGEAKTGREAIETARQELPDVVLMDVRMPDLDGPQTLAALQRINPAVTCCFMTGHPGEYTPEDLLALGAIRLFDKPFRVDEMAQALWQTAQLAGRRTG